MMAARNIVNRWICVASALAVLVAVMTSPIRPLTPGDALFHPNCLRRNFGIPPTRSASFSLKSLTQRAAPVKAVRSENEEEKPNRVAYSDGCCLSPPPSSSLKTLAWAPPALGLTPASPPLRC
jgi:hypothetical protein